MALCKRSAKLAEIEDIRDQLTTCCSEELYEYEYLYRSFTHNYREMKRLALPHHSDLVNIVDLRSVTQEMRGRRGFERVRTIRARICEPLVFVSSQ